VQRGSFTRVSTHPIIEIRLYFYAPWYSRSHEEVCISRFTTLQATLAAANIAAHLQHYPVWTNQDVLPFVDGPFEEIPKAAPSIVNAKDLGLKEFSD
jgi:hypothetical protein